MKEQISISRYGRNADGSIGFLGTINEKASKVSYMEVLDETAKHLDGSLRTMVLVTLLSGDTYLTDKESKAVIVEAAAAQH